MRGDGDRSQQGGTAGVGAEMNLQQDQVTKLRPNSLPPELGFPSRSFPGQELGRGMSTPAGSPGQTSPKLQLVGAARGWHLLLPGAPS